MHHRELFQSCITHQVIICWLILAVASLIPMGLRSAATADENAPTPFFACGVKAGQINQTSATIWVRLTAEKEAQFDRLSIFSDGLPSNAKDKIRMLPDIVPGAEGLAKVKYWIEGQPDSNRATPWQAVSPKTDYTHQFKLDELTPGVTYQYEVSAKHNGKASDNKQSDSAATISAIGRFRTAPSADQSVPVQFVVSTCQAIRSIDSGKQGHRAYRQMLAAAPDFFVHTGDILYYDKAPIANNKQLARAKWNLMFAYGYNQKFHQNVGSYFLKDDHDTLKNDCWPGQRYGELTFEQGKQIFREQVPVGDKPYSTVRWGRDLQIWMTENRDFRSPNSMPDGPEKTILGAEQKSWLKKSLTASDATFKFVISPGPIVGPDKPGKNDNHSNPGFNSEGLELRKFLATQKNTYVICGDRHWQYCSQDPATSVIELGCGPVNDEHDFGGNSGRHKKFHRYFSGKGGFLLIKVNAKAAVANWHHANDPNWQPGQLPQLLHNEHFPAVQ